MNRHTDIVDELTLKELLLKRAASHGPSVRAIVEQIWVRSIHSALSETERFLSLARTHSTDRLEAASRRAIYYGHSDYRTVDSLLMRRLEALPLNPYTDLDGQLLFGVDPPKESN